MHVFQVGAGSGGIVVLDLLARDPRITAITLVEPDRYKPHNVHRHLFPTSDVGQRKADLAADWVRARRPDLNVITNTADLTDPTQHAACAQFAAACDVGVCAVDNEPAKFAFDALMRAAGKPWSLGEVLSGGIGGWVHRFTPNGPCYGCVASHLQRHVAEEAPTPPPDYANPQADIPETTVPASKASIEVIAGLHALATLDLLTREDRESMESFTSLLFTLQRVPGIFDEPYRVHKFRIPKSAACLVCSTVPAQAAGEDLDVALDQALGRLGHE